MKNLVLSALLALTTISASAAYDCHLAKEGAQDSLHVFYSCNTGEGHYNDADAVCAAECRKAADCHTYYVNTYRPVSRPCAVF